MAVARRPYTKHRDARRREIARRILLIASKLDRVANLHLAEGRHGIAERLSFRAQELRAEARP